MNIPITTPGTLARGSLLASLLASVTLNGAVSAQAAPPPDGQRVHIECQAYGEEAYGSRLWDLVSEIGRPAFTKFVPDRFIRTGTSGRAEEIRRCGKDEENLDD